MQEPGEREALVAALRWQVAMGADEALAEVAVDRLASATARLSPAPAVTPGHATPRAVAPASRHAAPPSPPAQEAAALAAACHSLAELREAMSRFEGSPLRETATNLVFADGIEGAATMLVGEAPGADEDRLGKPFVGASGRLLDRMLASVGLSRETDCYLANILPFRPPGNRTPTDAEVAMFLPFLRRHVALARPRRLVLLGGTAAKALLGAKEGITRLRGRWYQVTVEAEQVLPALPTLHPAYLLRNPVAKREAWQDMLRLRREGNDG